MNETSTQGTHPTDRETMLNTIGAELDEMGWRNLRYVEKMLSPYSLTFPQAMVLSFLQRMGPDVVMSRIAELSGLPASTITSVMDRLVKRGLAERQQGATDRRSITGSITDEGLVIISRMEAARDASLRTMLADFPDEELAVLLKLIARWAEMTESLESGG